MIIEKRTADGVWEPLPLESDDDLAVVMAFALLRGEGVRMTDDDVEVVVSWQA